MKSIIESTKLTKSEFLCEQVLSSSPPSLWFRFDFLLFLLLKSATTCISVARFHNELFCEIEVAWELREELWIQRMSRENLRRMNRVNVEEWISENFLRMKIVRFREFVKSENHDLKEWNCESLKVAVLCYLYHLNLLNLLSFR